MSVYQAEINTLLSSVQRSPEPQDLPVEFRLAPGRVHENIEVDEILQERLRNVVLSYAVRLLHAHDVENPHRFLPSRRGIGLIIRVRTLARPVEHQLDAVLARELVVVHVEEKSNVRFPVRALDSAT
jgi:hypothetical protein